MRTLSLSRLLAGGLAAAALIFATSPAPLTAQTPQEIRVKVGASAVVPLPRVPKFLSVEDPSIASAEVLPQGKVKVTGKKPGATRLVGRGFGGVPMVIAVKVLPAKLRPSAP